MYRIDARKSVNSCDGMTRRNFLQTGSLSLLGLGLSTFEGISAQAAAARDKDVNCIMLFLVGGPSQLDTWDMKPDAPSEIRGPFRPIDTNVPGIQISECFPKLATRMDKVALVRSIHHDATAVHDTGHQMMQTGRLFSGGVEHPHIGSALAKLKGPRGDAPPHVLLPRPIGNTGGGMPHGQSAGYLGKSYDPFVLNSDHPADPAPIRVTREALDLNDEADTVRNRYGRTRFGQNCLQARRLIESGVRFVTVNMFETVFNETTWDIHGSAPFSSIGCYKNEVGPNFDNAYSALLADLYDRGLLDTTIVVAFGEFGRTPKLNASGGRDHHPGCWTGLFAGGPIQGGRVVGTSDAIGHSPLDRPVTPAEIVATIYDGLGIPLNTELPGPQGTPIPIIEPGVEPIHELL